MSSVAYRVEAKRRRDNPETGEEGYKTVKRTFIKESDKIVHVTITNDDNSKFVTIDATPGHPFYVVGYRFKYASELKIGDKLRSVSGDIYEVTDTEVEHFAIPIKVYNFEVEDWHTYAVSEVGIVVHNSDTCVKSSDSKNKKENKSTKNTKKTSKKKTTSSNNYKKTFFDKNPDLEGEVVVHHGIEQQVLRREETKNLFTEQEIHSYENLRGIPKEINSELHLSDIRKEWNKFYKENPNPTKEMMLLKRAEIDKKYGHLFNPPIEDK